MTPVNQKSVIGDAFQDVVRAVLVERGYLAEPHKTVVAVAGGNVMSQVLSDIGAIMRVAAEEACTKSGFQGYKAPLSIDVTLDEYNPADLQALMHADIQEQLAKAADTAMGKAIIASGDPIMESLSEMAAAIDNGDDKVQFVPADPTAHAVPLSALFDLPPKPKAPTVKEHTQNMLDLSKAAQNAKDSHIAATKAKWKKLDFSQQYAGHDFSTAESKTFANLNAEIITAFHKELQFIGAKPESLEVYKSIEKKGIQLSCLDCHVFIGEADFLYGGLYGGSPTQLMAPKIHELAEMVFKKQQSMAPAQPPWPPASGDFWKKLPTDAKVKFIDGPDYKPGQHWIKPAPAKGGVVDQVPFLGDMIHSGEVVMIDKENSPGLEKLLSTGGKQPGKATALQSLALHEALEGQHAFLMLSEGDKQKMASKLMQSFQESFPSLKGWLAGDGKKKSGKTQVVLPPGYPPKKEYPVQAMAAALTFGGQTVEQIAAEKKNKPKLIHTVEISEQTVKDAVAKAMTLPHPTPGKVAPVEVAPKSKKAKSISGSPQDFAKNLESQIAQSYKKQQAKKHGKPS